MYLEFEKKKPFKELIKKIYKKNELAKNMLEVLSE